MMIFPLITQNEGVGTGERDMNAMPNRPSMACRFLLPVLALLIAASPVSAKDSGFVPLQPLSSAQVGAPEMARTNAGYAEQSGLSAMSDEEMAAVSGQALFQTQKIVGDGSQAGGTSGYTFYRVGLDAELDLNMNIENLELGRTGPDNWPANPFDVGAGYPYGSYTPNVDLWGKNLALGCTADGAGNCVDSSVATQLKPLNLLRPYFEFAIKNDGTKTQREVIGIRLGAENIEGPMSFGQMRAFSGYLTATASLTFEPMTDVAGTCGAYESGAGTTTSGPFGGCPRSSDPNTADGLGNTGANIWSGSETCNGGCDFEGSNWISMTADPNTQYSVEHVLSPSYNGNRGALGLDNDEVCSLGLCAQLAATTVDIASASSPVLDAAAHGKRLTQALVLYPRLGDLVDTAVNGLTINQCNGNRWNDGLACTGGSWFPGLIRGPAGDLFKEQICAGLGITNCTQQNLNETPIPYNLTNFHQVDVNTNALGLSFQREAVRYPGYALATNNGTANPSDDLGEAVMQQGWSLYLPNAFFLPVSEPTAVFTNNIANGSAGRGDLVALDPAYDNCWGSATFC